MHRSDQLSLKLWTKLPQDQIDRVMGNWGVDCDIGPEFLGFMHVYEPLSKIIPKHWTVVDLGCAYAPQAWYFRNHKAYIGVNPGSKDERFSWQNTDHFEGTIQEFIAQRIALLDLNEVFGICSYVPPWYELNKEDMRRAFPNLFTFYPYGTSDKILAKMRSTK